MIVLLAMLLGADFIRVRWHIVAGLGVVWTALGLFIFIDALDNVSLIPVHGLGYLLLIEGLASLLASLAFTGASRRLRVLKGLGALAIGGLAIETSGAGDVALALLIGAAFACDGVLRIAAARVVRFAGWRTAQAMGVLSLLLAVATLQPWPTWYVGTIGCNVGIAFVLSGLAALILARRLYLLQPGGSIAELVRPAERQVQPSQVEMPFPAPTTMTVRVWTPAGPAHAQRGVIDRYIAAVDSDGKVSTGHSALEADGIYISHYPREEIERSPGSFGRVLRATADNDAPGLFQPSYAEESAGWCPANAEVQFRRFDALRLYRFWDAYRQDDTYNLTNRNCSSVVAHALDAALEGVLLRPGRGALWREVVRAACSQELWAAHLLRMRAESMAWTPGLVLDYARAMAAAVDPAPVALVTLVKRLRPGVRPSVLDRVGEQVDHRDPGDDEPKARQSGHV